MFASTSAKPDRDGTKDSVAQIRETGVFCVNVVEYAMRDVMNLTSGNYAADVDEFALAGLTPTPCETIDCARVAEAPANLECQMTQIVQAEGEANFVVIGTVTGVHLRDDCVVDGTFDVLRFNPLTRMGYRDYSVIREKFPLKRPGE
jgi:flavin reductase (DIM6/NTAB) family NADH-FMN oxidoreductase RutF